VGQLTHYRRARSFASRGGYVFDRRRLAELQADLGPAEMQIAADLFIGPVRVEERDGGMIFSNHSCEPNIGVQGQIVFVAIRDVAAGEELSGSAIIKWTSGQNLARRERVVPVRMEAVSLQVEVGHFGGRLDEEVLDVVIRDGVIAARALASLLQTRLG
jgi:hypothetical protein